MKLGAHVEVRRCRAGRRRTTYTSWVVCLHFWNASYYLSRGMDLSAKPKGLRTHRQLPVYLSTFRIPRR